MREGGQTSEREPAEAGNSEVQSAAAAEEPGAPSQADLSTDDVFSLLEARRRRSTLRWLAESNGRGTAGALAEHIAAEENGTAVRELTTQQRKRVYIALYQNHLPMMADHGVINYDGDRGTIELTEAADVLFPYLELAADDSGGRGGRSLASTVRNWLPVRSR